MAAPSAAAAAAAAPLPNPIGKLFPEDGSLTYPTAWNRVVQLTASLIPQISEALARSGSNKTCWEQLGQKWSSLEKQTVKEVQQDFFRPLEAHETIKKMCALSRFLDEIIRRTITFSSEQLPPAALSPLGKLGMCQSSLLEAEKGRQAAVDALSQLARSISQVSSLLQQAKESEALALESAGSIAISKATDAKEGLQTGWLALVATTVTRGSYRPTIWSLRKEWGIEETSLDVARLEYITRLPPSTPWEEVKTALEAANQQHYLPHLETLVNSAKVVQPWRLIASTPLAPIEEEGPYLSASPTGGRAVAAGTPPQLPPPAARAAAEPPLTPPEASPSPPSTAGEGKRLPFAAVAAKPGVVGRPGKPPLLRHPQ